MTTTRRLVRTRSAKMGTTTRKTLHNRKVAPYAFYLYGESRDRVAIAKRTPGGEFQWLSQRNEKMHGIWGRGRDDFGFSCRPPSPPRGGAGGRVGGDIIRHLPLILQAKSAFPHLYPQPHPQACAGAAGVPATPATARPWHRSPWHRRRPRARPASLG